MKQESSKKSKKLIWLIAALVALLVVVGVVLAIFVLPGGEPEETGPVGGRPDLYWNVDRLTYIGDETSAGLSTREPAEDGLYHIRFSYNGELVEYTFADKRLVNIVDNMEVMTLVKDAEGNVVDALGPDTVATEVAKSFFVQRKNGNSLQLNSSIAMNGMQMPVELCELTQIYNVDALAEVPGQIDELDMMDKLMVYANDKGEVTHVYITERQPLAEVYWRVGKYWDSTNKTTTRVPDENGVYTLTFAKDGQQVELKCKDKAIVDGIDQKGVEYNAPKGLQFDEEGYIIAEVDPAVALRGKVAGSEYHITEMNGNQLTATYLLSGKENGKTFSVTVPEDCPIYNVCVGGSADMIGEPTELQMYDRIICYTDLEGKPILIFVMYRMANVPMYWNITRKYNSTTGETAREPVNGYYVFKMAVGGKQVTLRTKDKKIASTIDSFTYFMCGLEVEGDIIKRVYKPTYVSGNDYYGAGGQRFMISQTGVIMSFVTTTSGNFNSPVNLVMRPDVEIYDVTGYPGTTIGEPTTVNEGDTFRMVADYNNNITHIYVVARYTGKPIYYNFSRKYDTTKSETTRVPDAEGYYVYQMASRGKTVTVKTKDKNIASKIDEQNAPIVALDVNSSGIIRAAYEAVTSYKFGYKASNYRRFMSLAEDGTMTTMIESTGATDTWKVAEDVKIYNCSDVYSNNRGERVYSMQYWDQIQGVATRDDGLIKEIYVMRRQTESKFYYNISRKYNTTTLETTRKPDENGYYVFDLAVDGSVKQFRTASKEIATIVDAFNYVPFGMKVSGDIIKGAFAATSIKGVKAVGASNYDVMSVGGGKLSLKCYLPSNANKGKSLELPLASNYKAYNVSAYADPMGGKVKFAQGDRMICYTNMDGEVEWAWIWYKNTHRKGAFSYCEHCNKTVYWQPYSGNTYSEYEDVHLYVPADRKIAQENHGKLDMPESDRTEAVLDLNGFTLSASATRNFLVYGDLVILDTVGGGVMKGGKKGATANGGAIMIGKGGNVTLLSGTLTEDPEGVTNTRGGVVYLGTGGTFNMKGGEIYGGTATQQGGNIWIDGGTFNMSGGTVKGDIDVVSADAKINLSGKANITMGNEFGLKMVEGVILPLGGITADTKAVVDPSGIFTEKADNIESYLNNFSSSTDKIPLFVKDSALAGGLLKHCQHCDKEVYFTRFAVSGCRITNHMILVEDVTMSRQVTIGSSAKYPDDIDVAIDLNGYTITATKVEDDTDGAATGRFALLYADLSILDTSAAGTGKITSDVLSSRQAGLIMASTGATLNIYGGTLTMEEGAGTTGNGGILNVTGWKQDPKTGKVTPGGVLNMYGGVIKNGTAKNGGNIYVSGGSKVNLLGGKVIDGATIEPTITVTEKDKDGNPTKYSYTDAAGGNFHVAANATVKVGADTGAAVEVSGGKARIGGNAYVAAKGNFIIEKTGVVSGGSTVKGNEKDTGYFGGNIYSSGNTTIRGKVSNGTAYGGGNVYLSGGVRLRIEGGIVENGVATNYPGGNIYTNNGIVDLKSGALVTGGEATLSYGGNISAGAGGEVIIDDSTVSDGYAKSHAGNIYQAARRESKTVEGATVMVDDRGAITLTNGAVVSGGESAKDGGNIYTLGGVVNVTDSIVSGGIAKTNGGNIYGTCLEIKEDAEDKDKITDRRYAEITITNSEILDGEAKTTGQYGGGGNLYGTRANFVANGSLVSGGTTGECGGNILVSFGDITLGKDTVVKDGTITRTYSDDSHDHMGNNVTKFNEGVLTIEEGALVSGGSGAPHDVFASDSSKSDGGIILAGEVVGDVTCSSYTVNDISGTVTGTLTSNSAVKALVLSGAPKINTLNSNYVTLGELTDGAEIIVAASGVFTKKDAQKAADYEAKNYFKSAVADMDVVVWEDALATGVAKTCEYCGENVLWGAFDPKKTNYTADGHYIVTEDAYMPAQLGLNTAKTDSSMELVIDLNGKTIDTAARFARTYAKMYIKDSVGGGKIVGHVKDYLNGGLIMASVGSNTNIYGGTLTLADDAYAGSGGIFYITYGTLNIYDGATITGGNVRTDGSKDSEDKYSHARGGNIWLDASGILNMYGGTVSDGVAEPLATSLEDGDTITTTYIQGFGGNIAVKDGKANKITIHDGAVVSGGMAAKGGNIYIGKDVTATINGKVENGVAEPKQNSKKVGDAAPVFTTYGGEGGNIFILNGGADGGTTVGQTGEIVGGQGTVGGSIWTGYYTTILGKVTGGKATDKGGNVYHLGTLNVGKSDGSVAAEISSGEAPVAGNIYCDWKLNVFKNSVVKGGKATTGSGGNISANENDTVTINGTVTGGNAAETGGNITGAGGAKIYVVGGTVSDGTAGTNGGNINANNGYIYLQDGATVSGGTAAKNGGNLQITGANAGRGITIENSTVSGGTANSPSAWTGGGNIYLAGKTTALAELTITDSVIENGSAKQCGGNILVTNANATLSGTTTVSGGTILDSTPATSTATLDGWNIVKYNVGLLDIQDGVTVSGTSTNGNASVYISASGTNNGKIKIGGTVDGKVMVTKSCKGVTVTGNAKIADLALPVGGCKITVDNVTTNADVKVSGVTVGQVFTNELTDEATAEAAAKQFSVVGGTQPVEAMGKALVYGFARYCEHCDQEVLFTPYTDTKAVVLTEDAHYILKDDLGTAQITLGACENHGTATAKCNHNVDVVFDLNDHTLTSAGRTFSVCGKLTIQDTGTDPEKVGKAVSTSSNGNVGSNIHIRQGEVNLYGGEIAKAAGTECTGNGANIYVMGSFNMYGGTVSGGKTTANGGNIFVLTGYTFNMSDGTVTGGIAAQGGNIYASGANTNLNITGGTVKNGQSTTTLDYVGGGNIQVAANAVLNLSGDTTVVENGRSGYVGGNIGAMTATINMSGGTVKNGTTDVDSNQDNIRLSTNATMNFTGGTVYGTDGVAINSGSAITVNGSVMTLGGNASVARADGNMYGLVRFTGASAKLRVLTDWTGTMALTGLGTSGASHEGVTLTNATCGTMSGDTFTPGGNFTGTLTCEWGNSDLAITVVDQTTGAMKVATSVAP